MLTIFQWGISTLQKKKLRLDGFILSYGIYWAPLLDLSTGYTYLCPPRAPILGAELELNKYKWLINCGRDESHQGQVMLLWQHLTEEASSVWSFRKTFLRKWNWSWDLRCSIGEGQENVPSPGKKYGPPKEWQHARQLGQKVRAGEWHKVKLVRSGEPRPAGPASRSKQGCWTLFQEVTAGCKPSREGSPAEGQTLRSKKQARGQVQVQL